MIQMADILTVAGVLIGFEATSFAWRVQREATVGDQDNLTWLPPADYLNLLGLLVVGLGVFALPVLGFVGEGIMRKALGLGVVLWIAISLRSLATTSYIIQRRSGPRRSARVKRKSRCAERAWLSWLTFLEQLLPPRHAS